MNKSPFRIPGWDYIDVFCHFCEANDPAPVKNEPQDLNRSEPYYWKTGLAIPKYLMCFGCQREWVGFDREEDAEPDYGYGNHGISTRQPSITPEKAIKNLERASRLLRFMNDNQSVRWDHVRESCRMGADALEREPRLESEIEGTKNLANKLLKELRKLQTKEQALKEWLETRRQFYVNETIMTASHTSKGKSWAFEEVIDHLDNWKPGGGK